MGKLLIRTKDDRLLTVVRIGEPNKENGCNTILCRDDKGTKITITWQDVEVCYGSYNF